MRYEWINKREAIIPEMEIHVYRAPTCEYVRGVRLSRRISPDQSSLASPYANLRKNAGERLLNQAQKTAHIHIKPSGISSYQIFTPKKKKKGEQVSIFILPWIHD